MVNVIRARCMAVAKTYLTEIYETKKLADSIYAFYGASSVNYGLDGFGRPQLPDPAPAYVVVNHFEGHVKLVVTRTARLAFNALRGQDV